MSVIDDEETARLLRDALRELTAELSPTSDPLVRVHRWRRTRQRAQAGLAATCVAALAAIAILITNRANQDNHGATVLQLAGYTFRLPRGAHVASASPAACAMSAVLLYRTGPAPLPTVPSEPKVASAVTAHGGCVSMLLSAPYQAGAEPRVGWGPVSVHAITIDGFSGTLGTYDYVGRATTNGVRIPSGTRRLVMTLTLPFATQYRDLQVAASGVSTAELTKIVSSGLNTPAG